MNDTQCVKFPKPLAIFCCFVVRRMMPGREFVLLRVSPKHTHPSRPASNTAVSFP